MSAAHPVERWAVVTGASSGMGRCIALELASRGWATLLIARRVGLLESLAAELSSRAPSVALGLDLSMTGEVVRGVSAALARHGIEPSVLVNAAGFGVYRRFLEQPAELHESLWRVNYLGTVEMVRAVLPGMLARRRGHVINIASMSTKVGPWGHAGYAASKAGVVSVTQTLAAEHPYPDSGVRFSFVNPGIVGTAYFESESFRSLWPRVRHRAITPEYVARRVVGLLDRPKAELCIPFYYRAIQWIDAVAPGLAHRLVARESRPLGMLDTPEKRR